MTRANECEDCAPERCICYDECPAPTDEAAALRAALADPGGHPADRAAWRHELSILTRPERYR